MVELKKRFFLIGLLLFNVALLNHLQSWAQCSIQTCVYCDEKDECCSYNTSTYDHTFFAIRPQDSNAARRVTKTISRAQLFQEGYCGTYDISATWQESFRSCRLGQWFSVNPTNCMTIGIPGDGLSFDIDGTQLGLITHDNEAGLIGTFCLNPRIKNLIFNFDGQWNLDCFACGLWARIDIPLVWCRTDLGLFVKNTGDIGGTPETFPAGLFTLDCIGAPIVYDSIPAALCGSLPFGAVSALQYGKFSPCPLSTFNAAGIHFDIGYDYVREECQAHGASLHIVTPTGTRPNGRFLFEPVIGANRSWQLGVNVNGFYNWITFPDSTLSIAYDVTFTHLFKSRQRRVFSLKNNGAGSQYLLLKEFNAIGSILGAEQAANVLAGETKIGASAMLDGAVMLQYINCNFYGNIGYNLWYRSKEKSAKTVCFNNFNNVGIKGDQLLSVTQVSPCPDLPCISTCIPDLATASTSTLAQPGAADAETVLLTVNDIDFFSALHPEAFSNKIFSSVGYNWIGRCGRLWELLVGAEAEFGHRALSQWAVMVKAGVAF